MPIRVQRKRAKGWKMPPNTVYVGRGSYWGNPYKIGGAHNTVTIDAEWAVRFYEEAIARRSISLPFVKEEIAELRGKNLACWCALGQPCHADILLTIANKGA